MSKEFRDWLERVEMLTGERNDLTGNGMRMAYANAIQKYDELFEKVIIPQFVADWYEENKDDLDTEIYFLYEKIEKENYNVGDFYKWFLDSDNSIETLIKMKLFGYEVEQDIKYVVRIPNTINGFYWRHEGHKRLFVIDEIDLDQALIDPRHHFTEKEINELLPDVPEKYWEEI